MEEMIHGRWLSTAASIWIQCSTGTSYTFGIYSSTLKSSQSYSQSTLDTVSVFKDIGANAGILSGLLYSAVTSSSPGRRARAISLGPWLVHLAGAIQLFAGYFFIWASVVGLIPRPPVPMMCFFMWVAAHAQTFFNTANVVTGVHNFSNHSGTIVGIMKGFFGLSGAILIQVYETLFKDEPSNFILILALFPTLVSLFLMRFVRTYDMNVQGDKQHLNSFSAVALTIAAYLMVLIILGNVLTIPLWVRIITFSVLILLIFWPLRVAFTAMRLERNADSDPSQTETNLLLSGSEAAIRKDTEESSSHYPGSPSDALQETEHLNIIQAMCTGNFWLLFIAMVCGLGSGLATMNNISQIGESLGYSTLEINTLVSLLSTWNFLGRFGGGYISDIMLYRHGLARPLLMGIMLLFMTAGHVIIASGFPGNVYIGSTLVGICYGSLWSLMPTITSEIFGVRHMGTIFNTIAVGSPVGSYIFSVRVVGYIYDKEAKKGEDFSCYGTHCFMLSFLIMAFVAFLGFLVTLVLLLRTRSFYKLVLNRRSKHSQNYEG
ncbi:hypothetical protein SAY86_021522 [Trapa natans]|uniref:Major facilitator superfamily (MFS) profile domain-containing protein n=1 Tax=Trapa natans TaxID=22666 RepID=A0AAN7RFP8_TRANT|nr:hypothetical protein SAY86_021522 [Trapa natans]